MPQDQQQQQQQTFKEKHSRIKEKCVYLLSFCIVLYLHAIYRIVVVKLLSAENAMLQWYLMIRPCDVVCLSI